MMGFKKKIIVLGIALGISGCSVTPSRIDSSNIAKTAEKDLAVLEHDTQIITAPVTIDDAIARALKNNRERKLKALESVLSHGQIALASHEMLPSLTASAGYSYRDEYAASASVTFNDGEPDAIPDDPTYSVSQDKERKTADVAFTWNILDFGLSYVRAKQHADKFLISQERERKVAHNITQNVRAAYWKAVSADRLINKISPLITRASDALEKSREIEDKQLKTPLEALYYQRELLDILRALQSLRQDLVSAKTELAALMGLKPGTKFDLADVSEPTFTVPEVNIPLEHMEQYALQHRPELLETYYQSRISASETKSAMLRLLPGINLTAGQYHDDNEYLLFQDWASVGAQVSWNLLDVFKFGTERDLAKTREAIVEQQRLATSMAVLTQVHISQVTYKQAQKSFELADSYLKVAKRINQQTENNATAKRATELDLIRESLNRLLAELRRDVAYATLQNSYGRIFVSMGMDLIPKDFNSMTVSELSQNISEQFSQWEAGYVSVDVATTEIEMTHSDSVSNTAK